MADTIWLRDIDAAFGQARARGLPLLLYWGARWCPPCNRVKAVVFAHPRFAELARAFVALHVDGDDPLAQQLAERLRLRSYPTMVLYRPDGTEITRLAEDMDGEPFAAALRGALDARHTAGEALLAALSGERTLLDEEWRLLGNYSWDTDEQRLLGHQELDELAARLAGWSTDADAALRLDWQALAAAASAGRACADRAAAAGRIAITLADARALRAHRDLVIGRAALLVRWLTDAGTAERNALALRWSDALATLEADPALNLADRLAALRQRVRLGRLSHPALDLSAVARERVAAALEQATDPALRHAVVNTAAGLLIDAGLADEAERVLRAALPDAHSPYYFMHTLAGIARRRGDAAAAADWYERAWQAAPGQATRIQWGAAWLAALVELAPQDTPRIERAAHALLELVESVPDARCQRNRTQLGKIRDSLARWQGVAANVPALARTVDALLA